MSKPNIIRVRITLDGENSLKVIWEDGDAQFQPYFIDRQMIMRISKEIRKNLNILIESAMDSADLNSCGVYLNEIAKEGNKLYKGLFTKNGGEEDPKKIQEWLFEYPQPCRVTFNVDKRVHIPWGLVFDSDTSQLPNSVGTDKIKYYESFWCLKYFLTTLYFRITPIKPGGFKRDQFYRCISVLNKSAYEEAYSFLKEDEQNCVQDIFSKFEDPIYSKNMLFSSWKQNSEDIGFLYFYCHSNGNRLSLDINDEVEVDDFYLELNKESSGIEKFPCLVFLNGCSTAIGDPEGGFIEVTGGKGFCGFIGTETLVPNVFALRFSMEFVHYLLKTNFSILQVMDFLRRKHWPLSLIYGTYCYPIFEFSDEDDALEKTGLFKDNFSNLNLGSQKLND